MDTTIAATDTTTTPTATATAPATAAANTAPTAEHKSLTAAVYQHLSMDSGASSSDSPTNSSSEPSPQANHKPEAKLALSPPLSPKANQIQEPLPEQDVRCLDDKQQQEENTDDNHELDEVEELKQTLLRKSTGSIAIMTRQQEAFDHRRHTFSAMSADSRASMRRRSYDNTPFGRTYPPSSPPLAHSLKTHDHLPHWRVYGKSFNPAKRIGENHQEGAAVVSFVSPGPDTVWTRGKPVEIEWKVLDATVDSLCIELLEDGQSATTLIAQAAPNSGFFTYHKVPWGMESGSRYFLRVSAAGEPGRFRTSGFFQISSAP